MSNALALLVLLHHTKYPQKINGVSMGIVDEFATAYTHLLAEGLLMVLGTPTSVGSLQFPPPAPHYAVTEKGRVYIDALCTVPLPIQAWTMPKEKK